MFRARGLQIELRVKFELKVQARGERNGNRGCAAYGKVNERGN